MHYQSSSLILAPTDLSNYIDCHHLTNQDLRAASEETTRPFQYGPVIEALRERGLAHEKAYKQHLVNQGRSVVDVKGQNLLELMRSGVDVLYRARLGDETWSGIADFLIKVNTCSSLGSWSYEVLDTKLAKETKGSTVLQLSVYSFLLSKLQDLIPQHMHVVTPRNGYQPITYRSTDYAAYFRLMESGIKEFLDNKQETYPEKVPHCETCAWWKECEDRRRADDHLCYVAGITNRQINELNQQGITKLKELATSKEISEPVTGSLAGLLKLRDQARIQWLSLEEGKPKHQVKEPFDQKHGFALLPKPTTDDIFLDFEGDHFADDGVQEYLVGYVTLNAEGNAEYTALWAETHEQEQRAFETFIDIAIETLKKNASAHIYHFASYEPAALKRLMGRYSTRSQELDKLLRGKAFVDLHTVVKRSLIASVESYSIKNLEEHYKFKRDQDLRQASISRRIIEFAIETGEITEELREHKKIVETYNRDDCVSTQKLQGWLENLRSEAVAQGNQITRPDPPDSDASEEISKLDRKLHALRDALLEGISPVKKERSREEQAKYILAHILEFHRREDRAVWWEKFRVLALEVEELEEERRAINGLKFLRGADPESPSTQEYTFPPQELDARHGDGVFDLAGNKLGEVVSVNYGKRTINIKKPKKATRVHPSEVVFHNRVPTEVLQKSLIRFAESVINQGFRYQSPYEAAINLLLVNPPADQDQLLVERQTTLETACQLATETKGKIIAIQGPPGTGKTYAGGHMICACKKAGLKVGVTAVSHEVIVNLLEEACQHADKIGIELSVVHRQKGEYNGQWGITRKYDYDKILEGLQDQTTDVVGATAWAWARPDHQQAVDILFVDEAGQMALGNTLAMAQGGQTIVLLGDPQQLEQPTQSSHPEHSDVSALEYFLDGAQTMPTDRGLFLEKTWRLHPKITAFTSEVYYEGRLSSVAELKNQSIVGSENFSGSGLRCVPVTHKGNTSRSSEEVEVVADIVAELLSDSIRYQDKEGKQSNLGAEDILIVTPYNAQVALLSERLPSLDRRIGTVNKFQGKGAPVVIYSMASSSPEDAPRGMEFLYDPHRLNVATSRAKAMCILVSSPDLFKPSCNTPQQMKMANGMCRFLELLSK